MTPIPYRDHIQLKELGQSSASGGAYYILYATLLLSAISRMSLHAFDLNVIELILPKCV